MALARTGRIIVPSPIPRQPFTTSGLEHHLLPQQTSTPQSLGRLSATTVTSATSRSLPPFHFLEASLLVLSSASHLAFRHQCTATFCLSASACYDLEVISNSAFSI